MEKIEKPTDKRKERRKDQYNTLMEFFELNKITPNEAMDMTLTFIMSTFKRMKLTPYEVQDVFNLLAKAYKEDEF